MQDSWPSTVMMNDIIKTAVETTSVLVLDSKRVSLETRLKKKSDFLIS